MTSPANQEQQKNKRKKKNDGARLSMRALSHSLVGSIVITASLATSFATVISFASLATATLSLTLSIVLVSFSVALAVNIKERETRARYGWKKKAHESEGEKEETIKHNELLLTPCPFLQHLELSAGEELWLLVGSFAWLGIQPTSSPRNQVVGQADWCAHKSKYPTQRSDHRGSCQTEVAYPGLVFVEAHPSYIWRRVQLLSS
jgi:hypothetical protein